jgi:hypothetical protein
VTMSKLGKLVPRGPALALGILALAFAGPWANTHHGSGPISSYAPNLLAVFGADAVTLDRNAREYKLPTRLNGKAVLEAPAKRRFCLAILPSPVCMSNFSNAALTIGASRTLTPMIDSSPCSRERC